MAKPGSSPRPLPKAPPRPPQRPSEKTGAKAGPAPAGRPPTKPTDPKAKPTDPKAAKPANLPDAALLDDEATDGEAPAAASGVAAWLAWLPAGRKRWIVLGSAASGLIAMIAVAAFAAASHFRAPPPPPAPTTISGPAAAVDGATVTINGHTVHLEAVDAPPASLICRDGAWKYNCGAQARRALDEAISKAPVDCENLRSRADGRVTALCRNDTGLDLAAIQVESGWAVNDMRTSSRYIAEESRAEAAGNGLWRNDFAHPEQWHDQAAQSPAPQNAASVPR
jgi:endonuclease YncB( thermonuclease family)